MNRNTTALILIVLAVGIYFTFTRAKIDEIKGVIAVNSEYQKAIDNANRLLAVREEVRKAYNDISEGDKERLSKIIPSSVDNVRLIIDIKDDIAARNGLYLKNIKTTSPDIPSASPSPLPGTQSNPNTRAIARVEGSEKYGVVTMSFSVTASYEQFIDFLKDLESSLRILDISKLVLNANDTGTYDFNVELKTYWIK